MHQTFICMSSSNRVRWTCRHSTCPVDRIGKGCASVCFFFGQSELYVVRPGQLIDRANLSSRRGNKTKKFHDFKRKSSFVFLSAFFSWLYDKTYRLDRGTTAPAHFVDIRRLPQRKKRKFGVKSILFSVHFGPCFQPKLLGFLCDVWNDSSIVRAQISFMRHVFFINIEKL